MLFTAEDRAIALALLIEEDDVCPGCGSHADETIHDHPPTPVEARAYDVGARFCHACGLRQMKAANYDGDDRGLLWAVSRRGV